MHRLHAMLTIRTPTPDPARSRAFYQALGYTPVEGGDGLVVTDGQVVVVIDADRRARPGVTLHGEDRWRSALDALRALTPLHEAEAGWLLNDLAGCWIRLVSTPSPAAGGGPDAGPSILGDFAGLSLEATDVRRTAAVWQALGFTVSGGGVEQPWVALRDPHGFAVSLMRPLSCPHLFFSPSLTYFNGGRNLQVIEEIRAAGVAIAEEVTVFNDEGVVDNVILQDPGGYGIFVFND